MIASTSAGSASPKVHLRLGPLGCGRRAVHLKIALIPGWVQLSQSDQKGVAGWPATLASLAAGSPGRPLRSWQDLATRQLQSSLRHHPRSRNCVRLCLSATCVDDSEPDPDDAGWRAATGYQPRPPAARCLGANRRTPRCRQPSKQARGSVDNMRILSTYRPRRLGRSPTWNSHSTVRPFTVLQHAAQPATAMATAYIALVSCRFAGQPLAPTDLHM